MVLRDGSCLNRDRLLRTNIHRVRAKALAAGAKERSDTFATPVRATLVISMKTFASLTLLLLGGCAVQYVAPPSASNAATLTTVHLSWFDPSSTRVTALNNPDCIVTDGFGRLSNLKKVHGVADEPQSSSITAGQRLYLAVTGTMRGDYTKPGGYTDYTCLNVISFTPAVGG